MKVACFLNSPYLGGAERSFVHQVKKLVDSKNCDIDFVVPYLKHTNESKDLMSYIKENHFSLDSINTFQFDHRLYSVSRSWPLFKIVSVAIGFLSTLLSLNKYSYRRHKVWWVNGNKIGFVCFILAYLTGFKGRFIWHFRDYPALSSRWSLIWPILKLPKLFHLQLIGNSHSVSQSLRELNITSDVQTLYNPVKTFDSYSNEDKSGHVLGLVSMMAPWKGIHDVLLFISLYESELIKMGIDIVHVYGGDLYKTAGAHNNYFDEVQTLNEKLKTKIVVFKGLCSPRDIYQDIDFLLHSSNKPEPFGRVIMEAMSCGIPVVSTGLGGAGELIKDKVSGVIYDTDNHLSLLKALQYAIDNKSRLIISGRERFQSISHDFNNQLHLVFKN